MIDYEKLFDLANPFLEKNDFGMAHTRRVFDIARKNFPVDKDLQELTFSSIVLHDIGGSTIKEQYAKGPKIAASLLKQMGCDAPFIQQVCEIIATHHEHPDSPSPPFRILYDSDKLVMFSPEEFHYYNPNASFDWNEIMRLLYSDRAKSLAKELLQQRRSERNQLRT